MSPHRSVESLHIEIPRGYALRLLGMPPGSREPRPSLAAVIDEMFALGAELVSAKAVLGFSHGGLPGSSRFDLDAPLVAVVCTIGAALEERVRALAASGEAARAMVLDAVGSSAAEEVADRVNRLVCEMAAPTDLVPERRESPGYGRWDVREQEAIFAFLEPSDIGDTLTRSCMMVPRKSISYVVRLGTASDGAGAAGSDADGASATMRFGDRCAVCGMDDCPYREGPHAARGGGDELREDRE